MDASSPCTSAPALTYSSAKLRANAPSWPIGTNCSSKLSPPKRPATVLSAISLPRASSGQCAPPRGQIGAAVNAVAPDHHRLAAVHGGDSGGDLLRHVRLAHQRELRIEDDAGCNRLPKRPAAACRPNPPAAHTGIVIAGSLSKLLEAGRSS